MVDGAFHAPYGLWPLRHGIQKFTTSQRGNDERPKEQEEARRERERAVRPFRPDSYSSSDSGAGLDGKRSWAYTAGPQRPVTAMLGARLGEIKPSAVIIGQEVLSAKKKVQN